MVDCLLGLGSNIGDRRAQLDTAVQLICGHPQIQRVSTSSYHATRPVGGPTGQDVFLNAALRIRTTLTVGDLFAVLQDVEQRLGRRRLERWGPRTIDIDILFYGQEMVTSRDLIVPHPRMAVRRFVLAPAREVAADMRHPGTGASIAELLDRLARPPHYVAITGFRTEQAANLAVTAATICGLHVLLGAGPTLMSQDGASVWHDISVELLQRVHAERRDQLVSLWSEAELAPAEWHVSSFWLPELIAVARARLAPESRAKLEQAYELAAGQVPVPHCVVFLDPRLDGKASEAACRAADDWADAVAQELSRPGSPPCLHVPGAALQVALTELTAAVDAMR
jgi:2-amino-4-hydroxy-6-hydroxymethyldihydropteridine diphosphokinase